MGRVPYRANQIDFQYFLYLSQSRENCTCFYFYYLHICSKRVAVLEELKCFRVDRVDMGESTVALWSSWLLCVIKRLPTVLSAVWCQPQVVWHRPFITCLWISGVTDQVLWTRYLNRLVLQTRIKTHHSSVTPVNGIQILTRGKWKRLRHFYWSGSFYCRNLCLRAEGRHECSTRTLHSRAGSGWD